MPMKYFQRWNTTDLSVADTGVAPMPAPTIRATLYSLTCCVGAEERETESGQAETNREQQSAPPMAIRANVSERLIWRGVHCQSA